MIGIYKIVDATSGKVYIGQSRNISERIKSHKQHFARGDSSVDLYRFCECPEFSIIEECDESKLDGREKFWINHYDSFLNGFNMTLGGEMSTRESLEWIVDNAPHRIEEARFKHLAAIWVDRLEKWKQEWIKQPYTTVENFFKYKKYPKPPKHIMDKIKIEWMEAVEQKEPTKRIIRHDI